MGRIGLSEDLEDIFRIPNLFNVLVGSIEICSLGFNIMAGARAMIPASMLLLFSELLQIFGMSFFGENIIRESNKIGQAAYLCEWDSMDIKSKKSILILMTRAQRPQRLTAYKFSIICYKCFTTIISSSWSYFTLLRTFYKPSEGASSEEML